MNRTARFSLPLVRTASLLVARKTFARMLLDKLLLLTEITLIPFCQASFVRGIYPSHNHFI